MEALIKEYGRGYEMLREAINGLTEEELRFKQAPDKWSIHEILIHVTDSEILSTHRLKKSPGGGGACSDFVSTKRMGE